MASSREYWKLREEAQRQNNIRDEYTYNLKVRGIYDDTYSNVQKQIDAFYQRYAEGEGLTLAEAKKRVEKIDMEAYERKAARYVKERNFSKQANEEMRLYNLTMKINRLEMLKSEIGLELASGYNDLEKLTEEVLTATTKAEMQRLAGILGNSIHDNPREVHAIVNASFHSATYSERIWSHQDQLRDKISELVVRGLIGGEGSRKLGDLLAKEFGVSRYNAQRLMQSEMARCRVEAQKKAYEVNGTQEYQFLALGAEPCDNCGDLDGQHFLVKDMVPGQNAPPMHPWCHCSTAPYEDKGAVEQWIDFLDAGGTTEEYEAETNASYEGVPKTWPKGKTISEDVALSGANPNYRKVDGYDINCVNSCVAYEMRRRGHNVEAASIYENKRLRKAPFSGWVNPDILKTDGTGKEAIETYLRAALAGTRVQITIVFPTSIFYNNSTGHSFIGIKTKEGTITYVDPQTGESLDANNAFKDVVLGKTKFCRIDNLEISDRGVSACKVVDKQ